MAERHGLTIRSRVRPPAVPRVGWDEMPRTGLLARLAASPAGLVLVTAPAGYGKTTLLAQMARAAEVPVAWLTLTPGHRAPGLLESAVDDAAAAAAAGGDDPFLLVLDDVDVLGPGDAAAALEPLVAGLPEGARVAIGCRAEPGLLLGRRLMEGGALRIGVDDLAFDAPETDAFLAGAGITLEPDALAALRHRTEGWPAGLRLAAVRIAGAPDPSEAARGFTGADRLVADYLYEVVLGDLPPETMTFLTRTSVLDLLSGDLCDAVLGTAGSGMRLLELGRSDLPLVEVDSEGERHRYHRLLGDVLRRELGRREPDLVPCLHSRAAVWHQAAGEWPAAVRHARAAGEADRAAAMLWAAFPGELTRGGVTRLRGVLDGFTIDEVAASVPLAVASAWCHAETRGDLAAHHLSLAERAPSAPDGSAAAVATLRAMLGTDGLPEIVRRSRAAFRAAPDDGPWRAWCRFLEAAAVHLGGDPAGARVLLDDGIERAGRVAPSVHALCLAQLGLVLIDVDEPVRGLMMARRSRAVVEEWGLGGQGSAALAYAGLALALALSGHSAEARDNLGEAARVQLGTVDAAPWLAVHVRVTMARAALALGDDGVAEEALDGAQRFLGRLGDAPLLRAEVERLGERVCPAGAGACPSITAAEARVLQLLPTHHSVREIGDLLFLSRFTVKSHAHSLYRKLGVSGRSEAVERARELRILPR